MVLDPSKSPKRIFKSLSRFSQKEIAAAFNNARCLLKLPEVTLLASPRQIGRARILIVTPRTVGNAPQRNKLRRQLKAIFYENRLYEGPVDYLVLLKKGALRLGFERLKVMLVEKK